MVTISRAWTHHIKDTRVLCCTPKTFYDMLTHWFLIHLFSTLFVLSPLLNAFSVYIQLFLYFTSFIKYFLCTCYQSPLKRNLNHSMYKALQFFILFVYEARTTAGNVCWVWSRSAPVYRNIHIAAVTIDFIRLQQGIWALAWGKLADFNAPHVMSKMYKHRIWLKLKNFRSCTLWWV